MREWFDRAWPSLIALVGTVGVVVALLVLFGDDTGGDGSAGDAVTAATDEPTEPATDNPEPDDEPEDEENGQETDGATEEPDDEPTETATEAPEELRTPVGVANQTSVEGLELDATERIEAGGWEVAATSPFTGNVPETTVYFPPGMEESAEALSRQFPEIGRVRPTFEGVNQTRLVIVLVEDYVDEVGG